MSKHVPLMNDITQLSAAVT